MAYAYGERRCLACCFLTYLTLSVYGRASSIFLRPGRCQESQKQPDSHYFVDLPHIEKEKHFSRCEGMTACDADDELCARCAP